MVFSVLLENSGLLKAGPRQAEFEPLQQKPVKFSDVHGVDEVKEVRPLIRCLFNKYAHHRVLDGFTGAQRCGRIP